MRITVLNGDIKPEHMTWEGLEKCGDLTAYASSRTCTDEEMTERLQGAEIAVTMRLTGEMLGKLPDLKAIVSSGTGYNGIDLDACKARGVVVCNNPSYGSYTVAQHAMALLMEITNRVAALDRETRSGKWLNNSARMGELLYELQGKTAGVIGFGRIGQWFGTMAKGMGMRVFANDGYPNDSGRAIAEYVNLDVLLRESDVISIHCPLLAETKGIINRETISKMKDGVIFINVARGELVNEEDLAAALKSGKIKAAGLDVVKKEPIDENNPLLECKNCLITPHMAWCTKEAQERMFNGVIDIVRSIVSGTPINVIS